MDRGATTQLQSIQILRAVAAIGVMVAHLSIEFTNSGAPGAIPAFPIGGVGVDLFFVISGFVMVYSSERRFGSASSPHTFLIGRLTRIVPLYWLATIMFLTFVLLVQRKSLPSANLSWDSIIASFFFIPNVRPNGQLFPAYAIGWTLNYEMFFYVIFALAVWLRRSFAVAAVALTIIAVVLFGPSTPPFSAWSDLHMLEFVAGMAICLIYCKDARAPLWLSLTFVLVGLALYVYGAYRSSDGIECIPRIMIDGIASSLIVAGFVLSNRDASRWWRWLAFLGDCSYSLYLFHFMTAPIPRRFFPWLISPAVHPWIFALVIVLINIATAIAIYSFIERPMTRAVKTAIGSVRTLPA